MQSAQQIGFSIQQAYDEILKLESKDFYKSETEYYNNKVWFDYYKKNISGINVYIKFKLVKNGKMFLLSSFKEDTGDGF